MKKLLAILLGTTLISGMSGSQAHAITLKEALEAAYQTNPEIMASRARLAAIDETYHQVSAQSKTRLDLEGFYGASRRSRSTIFSNRNVQEEDIGGELGLSLTKPLYQGGRVKALKKQSKAEIEAARQTLRSVQQKVFLEATTAYIDAVFDDEVLRLQHQHKAILDEMQNLVTTREEIGVGTETDIWRIKSRASAIEGDITRAETNLNVSETVFRQVTGRAAEDMNWSQSLSVPQSLDSAMIMARNNNPQLFEALSREESAAAAIDVAKSAYKPTVALVGSSFITDDRIEDLDNDFDVDGVTVGLNLRMPILNGGATKSRVKTARHELASRQFETALVERTIKSAVEQSWTQYNGAQKVRESIRKRMDNAQKTYRNIKIEFELGTRTIFDVVEAEQDYLNSQVAFLQSRRDAERAAALLLASMGMTDTIPHIQQVLPSGAAQSTAPAYTPLTKSDSVAELGRHVSVRRAKSDAMPVHKVVPQNKAQVFAPQIKSDAPSALSRRLRTRTMVQPVKVYPSQQGIAGQLKHQVNASPNMQTKSQVFESISRTDAPVHLGRQIRIAPPRPVVQATPQPSKAEIFSSVTAHDAPLALRRHIPIAMGQPRLQPRLQPLPQQQPKPSVKFNHALD